MKTTRKILSIVLALVMVLALGTTALAADVQGLGGTAIPPTDAPDCATYLMEETPAATSINVTFIMETADNYDSEAPAFYAEYSVELSSEAAKSFTVADVLAQVEDEHPEYEFEIATSSVTGNQNLTGVIIDDEYEYVMDGFTMAGWEFRVNDLFPVEYDAELPGYKGTTINETYLNDGDVVHFFWDDPETVYGYDYSTNYIRLVATPAAGSVTVQLQSQKVQVSSALVMSVENYSDFTTPTVVTVYDANGVKVEQATTNASGVVTFNGLTACDYTIKSASVVFDDPDEYYDYSGSLLSQTTGYTTVTVG